MSKKYEVRAEAQRIFIEKRGHITFKELGVMVSACPATISRWAKDDRWVDVLNATVCDPGQDIDDGGANGGDFGRTSSETDVQRGERIERMISEQMRRADLRPDDLVKLAEAHYHVVRTKTLSAVTLGGGDGLA